MMSAKMTFFSPVGLEKNHWLLFADFLSRTVNQLIHRSNLESQKQVYKTKHIIDIVKTHCF